MATYVFERITAAQAASFTSADTLVFIDNKASDLNVRYTAATGLTAASITIGAGSTSVAFPADALTAASQASRFTFADGSNLSLGNQTGGTTSYAGNLNTTYYGFNANDVFSVTGTGDSVIHGGGGADSLTGGAGNDYIFGGAGSTVVGATGPDTIVGGLGNDHLYGGDFTQGVTSSDNEDSILGGEGNDYIQGNAGNDTLNGGDGQDRIFGGDGNDSILGEAASDVINGNKGDDFIDGGAGNDVVRGGAGADAVIGGAGNDIVMGDLGADTITGGAGIDVVTGGDGADVFVFTAGDSAAGSTVDNLNPDGTQILDANGVATKLAGLYDSITDFVVGVDKIDVAGVTPATTTPAPGTAAVTATVLYAQTGVSFTSVTAATTYAQQLLDNAPGTGANEIAAIQVGSSTYLFSHETAGATATIDSIIRLDGVTASTITATDFV